jgi:hypothetical protein
MIDLWTVVAHAFWIAGLALILAALSYHLWLAGQAGRAFRRELVAPPFQRLLLVGLLLIGIGLSGASREPWQLGLAVALVVGAVVALVLLWRAK